VAAFTQSFIGADEPEALTVLAFARALILIVLLIAAVNVGALVYARGIARESEVAVRTALGATRIRIVSQLFAEAAVLAGVAALAGTVIVFAAVDRIDSLFSAPAFGEDIPFWFQAQVTPSTLLLVGCLAALAAIVTGVLPAFKITRRAKHRGFRQASGGGETRGFGKSASVIIVSQVAISVALLTTAVTQIFEFIDDLSTENDGIVRAEFVAAELRFDREPAVGNARDPSLGDRRRSNEVWPELGRRLSGHPEIRGVTFTTGLPGTENRFGMLEIEERRVVEGEDRRVWFSSVAPNYFDVFGLALNTGRSYTSADNVGKARSVIVNQQLVEQMFQSDDPIGRRIRVAQGHTTEWMEIIGVASNVVEVNLGSRPAVLPRVYFPLGEAVVDPIYLAVHARGDPAGLTGPLLQTAAEVEPGLVLHQPKTLEEAVGPVLTAIRLYGTAIMLLAFAALVLAASGVHALLGFTVSQRRREIGIRSALGAPPRRIVEAVFGRILFQLGLGTGLGVLVGLGVPGGPAGVSGLLANTTVALGVALLGVASCAKPLAGALRISTTEAITAS
jgi:predicted permease